MKKIKLQKKHYQNLPNKAGFFGKYGGQFVPPQLKEALKGTDIDDIKKKTEELQKVTMDLGSKVYEEAAKNQNATNENTTENKEKDKKSNDDVVDAEYEEK